MSPKFTSGKGDSALICKASWIAITSTSFDSWSQSSIPRLPHPSLYPLQKTKERELNEVIL